jgi:glycosyltransferase involved in cell wall biosynthesis
LNRTLSVLVPVSNAQATLGRLVGQLLEILPELTSKFEVAVVDQGSTDDTTEVARELSLAYPQISTFSLPRTADLTMVLRRGLSHTAGDNVLLLEPDCQADLNELPKLWALGRTHDLVVGVATPAMAQALPPVALGGQSRPAASRLRLMQRRVTWAWMSAETDEPLDAYLLRKRYRVCEVPIRACRHAVAAQALGRRLIEAMGKPSRLDPANAGPRAVVAVKRPSYLSYLSRFKTFALGE